MARILEREEISPRIIYRWINLMEQPREIIDAVNSGKMSMSEAFRIKVRKNRAEDPERDKLKQEILKEILNFVKERTE